MSNLTIKSNAFKDGQVIPKVHGYKNENYSPPLEISQIPLDTKSLVLIMDDPDAQAAVGKVWVHWIVWDISPDTTNIAQNSIPQSCKQGTTDFGNIGYGGPAPPDKEHTYVFKLYALDTETLDCKKGSNKAQVEDAMQEHIVAITTLKGRYSPDT